MRNFNHSGKFTYIVLSALLIAVVAFIAFVLYQAHLYKMTADELLAPQQEENVALLDSSENVINTGQLSDSSFLYDTDIADLASADMYYDGLKVQVTGEAVGEAIKIKGDSQHCWVTIDDSKTNSSVVAYMKVSDAEKIDTYGAYGKTGTIIKVQGTFNLACKDHQGESDIHVTSMSVVAQGSSHPDVFEARMFLPGAIAIGIGLVLSLIFFRMKERQR